MVLLEVVMVVDAAATVAMVVVATEAGTVLLLLLLFLHWRKSRWRRRGKLSDGLYQEDLPPCLRALPSTLGWIFRAGQGKQRWLLTCLQLAKQGQHAFTT